MADESRPSGIVSDCSVNCAHFIYLVDLQDLLRWTLTKVPNLLAIEYHGDFRFKNAIAKSMSLNRSCKFGFIYQHQASCR